MKTIAIIGAGFSGTMTAVQLIKKLKTQCQIVLFDNQENFNKGIAYNPYSSRHILNVIASKMSAFPDEPNHFVEWLMHQENFKNEDKQLIANSFLPRKLYGEYLSSIWLETLDLATKKKININPIHNQIEDLNIIENQIILELNNQKQFVTDICVIATGNFLPKNPTILNMAFYESSKYFQNPWSDKTVQNLNADLPTLIIGNGLTMVDTVLSITEKGYKGKIYSISPNGFNILPHRHNGMIYSEIIPEISNQKKLNEIFKTIKKHVQNVRKYGVSAEPIIDSLRPFTQSIWKSFSPDEKAQFMTRFRHLWGVARHRIPTKSHDILQQLRIEGNLKIISGTLINLCDNGEYITVDYFNKKNKSLESIGVSRIINCTGPDSNIANLRFSFLKKCLDKNYLQQDDLKLGIRTNTTTFQIIQKNGIPHTNLFTLGSNLRGELWESTAVNEIRIQADQLSNQLINLLEVKD